MNGLNVHSSEGAKASALGGMARVGRCPITMSAIKKSPWRYATGLVCLKKGSDLLSHFRSTIGAEGLNFSVRNGKRWIPFAIATLFFCHLTHITMCVAISFGYTFWSLLPAPRYNPVFLCLIKQERRRSFRHNKIFANTNFVFLLL